MGVGLELAGNPSPGIPAPPGVPAAPQSLALTAEGGGAAQGLEAPERGLQLLGSALHAEPTDPPQPASRSLARAHQPTHNSLISTIFRESLTAAAASRHHRASQHACVAPPPNRSRPGRACASAPFRRRSLRQHAWGLTPPSPRPSLGTRSLHCGCVARWRAREAWRAPAYTRQAVGCTPARHPPSASVSQVAVQPAVSSEFSCRGPKRRCAHTGVEADDTNFWRLRFSSSVF